LKKHGFYFQKPVKMKWNEQFRFGKKNLDIIIINKRNISIYLEK
jgi:hypothetical protein